MIQIRTVLVAGQQLFNSLEDQTFNKGNTLFNDRDDGVIIIAAFRRSGSTSRGKYKKVIETTTRKIVKVSTTQAPATTTQAPTTTTQASTTTTQEPKTTTQAPTRAIELTTVKVIQVTPKEVVAVTAPETVKVGKDIRRNQLAAQERQNLLWAARKRVTRPPTAYVQKKKPLKVNVVDEEDYSVRRARYLFTQRSGRK